MIPHLPVRRTFSVFDAQRGIEESVSDWFTKYSRRDARITWRDLLSKRLVVVLGEAGLGKTSEFRQQAKELITQGKPAFFLPLNELSTRDALDLVLEPSAERLHRWRNSNEQGYFFLDSVDEARLKSTAAFAQSLRLVAGHLLYPHADRATIIISSRISDWGIAAVQRAVEELLLEPLRSASSKEPYAGGATHDVRRKARGGKSAISIDVMALNPLDEVDAKHLAVAFGAARIDALWREVIEGGYLFMATRPLDLEWMVRRWEKAGKLGTYSELIENAVEERLNERNPGYREAGQVLSPKQLRAGAEALAAACVFSNLSHVGLPDLSGAIGALSAQDVLPGWKPQEIDRLLGTALFDEATFGQVKFHHRAVREFLAACWMRERLAEGLSLLSALELFVMTAYESPILLERRRATLCWLASMHAPTREYVIRSHPELLMFEGDPERWSKDDVVDAFDALLHKLAAGYRPNWYNDESELRRLARQIPEDVLCDQLTRFAKIPNALHRILSLVKYAGARACASLVRDLYCDPNAQPEEIAWFIDVLGVIGRPEDQRMLVEDLIGGRLKDAESIALAISAAGIARFSDQELRGVLRRIESRAEEATSTAFYVSRSLLGESDPSQMLRLLEALELTLPQETIASAAHDGGFDAKEHSAAWSLHAMSEWIQDAIELLPITSTSAPPVITRQCLLLHRLRDTTYVNDYDLEKARSLIGERPVLRRALALEIMKAKPDQTFYELIHHPGIVSFGGEDLPALLIEAARKDISADEQKAWFRLTLDVAIYSTRGLTRRNALLSLSAATDDDGRRVIQAERARRLEGSRTRRSWRREQRERKRKARKERADHSLELQQHIEEIRRARDRERLIELLTYSIAEGRSTRYSRPDIDRIRAAFGADIADAFREGLIRVWRTVDIKSPNDYPDHKSPWVAILGLASINLHMAHGLRPASLTPAEITRAVQLSVWEREHNSWLTELSDIQPEIVYDAIALWLDGELRDPTASRQRVTEFCLSAPSPLRERALARAFELIAEGAIVDEPLKLKLLRAMARQSDGLRNGAAQYAITQLNASCDGSDPAFPLRWFELVTRVDMAMAVRWVLSHLPTSEDDRHPFVASVAGVLGDSWGSSMLGSDEAIAAVTEFFDVLANNFIEVTTEAVDDGDGFRPTIRRLSSQIVEFLVGVRGSVAHGALIALALKYGATSRGPWLLDRVQAHAAIEAEASSAIAPKELLTLEWRYCREPDTVGQLFDQVLARLTDIKLAVERGPFSERLLLPAGIPEKHLQLWLASRLSDTPLRRFNPRFHVHREPVVDLDKRTDIELSARPGKVCVEIKPLDRERGYSAASLADTLRTQLVGQYLRGRNSKHGILVVLRLDDKQWEIPGKAGLRQFSDLVTFLEDECRKVHADVKDVEALRIVSIDCVSLPQG